MPSDQTVTPAFMIHLNGTRLPVDKEVDVKEIWVEENVDKPSHCKIIVTDNTGSWAEDKDIEIGATVKISLGYTDDYTEVFQGEITGFSSRFIEKGGKFFEIIGYNKLHRLTRVQKTKPFNDVTYSDIIKQIVQDAGLQCDIDTLGAKMKFCIQRNQTDYDFIMEIARKYNCKIWMDADKLCCKILKSGGQENVVAEWNKTLIDFQVEADASQLATAVEVRGWDTEKLETIVGNKSFKDITATIGGNDVGGKIVNDTFGENKIILLDDNIVDQNGADQSSLDLLTQNSFNYVTARGKISGNAKVKAGTNLSIQGVGTRFSGTYFIKSVKHLLSVDAGFTTHTTLIRNAI